MRTASIDHGRFSHGRFSRPRSRERSRRRADRADLRSPRPAPPPSGNDVRARARSLRELMLWDLRQEGFTFREIGALLGMTRQRASQLERKLIRRARGDIAAPMPHPTPAMLKARADLLHNWLRAGAAAEFEERLERINRFYQEQFERLLEHGYQRQRHFKNRLNARASAGFWQVWPCVEAYAMRPFSLSRLLEDFPQLREEPELDQLLARLRRTGLLWDVGEQILGSGYEVLMAEAPIEKHVAHAIERLITKWSVRLIALQTLRRPCRPAHSIELTRRRLMSRLLSEGIATSEVEAAFGLREDSAEERSPN